MKPAAAVVPIRADGQVLVGERSQAARSLPGYFAFPGGAVEPDDNALPLYTRSEHEASERACALRELGEETGAWLLCDDAGSEPSSSAASAFQAALQEEASLASALSEARLWLDDRALLPLGRWQMRRFQLRQFVLPVHPDAFVWTSPGPELIQIRWTPLSALRAAWSRGDLLLIPPIRFVIDALLHHLRDPADLLALSESLRLRDEHIDTLPHEIIEGIYVQPYRTPTLPPATTTNTVLLGTDDYFIVDPASPEASEHARFDQLLQARAKRGEKPLATVLTHHHPDHIGDAERLRSTWGIPIWAHAETAARLPFVVDKTLQEGDALICPGRVPRRFSALHTPGHAPGHLCFWEAVLGLLVAGDMVASEGSILIDPSEGDMGEYLSSLARLIALPVRRVVPAHGPLLAFGHEKLCEQLAHRQARQQQVLDVLAAFLDGASPAALVDATYGDTIPPSMHTFAARSITSALNLWVEQGVVEMQQGVYRCRQVCLTPG